jgi:flagellar biogenesis protein FliO
VTETELALRFVAALALIALGLSAFAAIAKRGGIRMAFSRRERLVELIETTPLPQTGSLHVVKVAESYLVIGRTDGGISLLGEVSREAVERAAARARPK